MRRHLVDSSGGRSAALTDGDTTDKSERLSLETWGSDVDERLNAGWEQVVAVAEKLEQRRRLTADEIGEVLAADPQGCPWPDFSPRFWPPEVPTPRGEFSVFASLGSPPSARLFHPE